MGERFEREVVKLALLAGNDDVVRDTVFEACHVHGPAVIVPQDCTFEHNTFRGVLDALLWEVPPERPTVIGAILADGCRFTGCTFERVGIAGPKAMLDTFRAGTDAR